VKRQMTITEGRPSTNEDAAHTVTLREFASKPASNPTIPSMLIQTSEAHDSWRARLAASVHSVVGWTGAGAIGSGATLTRPPATGS